MNLMEESFQTKEEKNKKRVTGLVLGAIVFVAIVIIAIVAYLLYIRSTELKVTLNGQSNEKIKAMLNINEENGEIYIPIRDIASYLGYESYKGDYSEKSEEDNKCYIQNENEVSNFTLGSNKIYKLDLTKNDENYNYIYTDKPIKAINGALYGTPDAIEKAFNIIFEYDQDKNRIQILTMPYLVQTYSTKVLDYGYSAISDTFENQKAILQNMLVVTKGENSSKQQYGVIDILGNVILEVKYDNITYLPYTGNVGNIGDFLVENNKKVGIMSANKETKVQIMYDSIDLMDRDAGLYLAKQGDKYGVIDLRGNTKIYIENDEIGMDISRFEQNNIKNKYLIAGNLIPVRKDNLWALYDKNGNLVVDFKYDSLGYVATNNKDELNLLVIPEYDVIVACKDKKYTLLNSSGEELFTAIIADDIYMTISGGKKQYWISVNDNRMNAEEYLDNIGVSKGSNKTNQQNSNNSNNSNNNNNNTNNNNNSNNSSNNSNNNNQGNTENVGNTNNNEQISQDNNDFTDFDNNENQ